jgi:aminoglycoside phosphotransferase (APT) family kinase protein
VRPAPLLRAALERGAIDPLAEAYADDAALDAGLVGGRVRATGREEIAGRLAEWYGDPGRLVEWSAAEHPGGAAVWLERVSAGGAARQRHYLRMRGGRIAAHWIYGAPPRTAAPAPDPGEASPPHALLARQGRVAEVRPIVSSGWSGDALVAVAMGDGRRLVAKRVVPGRGWIAGHTHDPGREGLLVSEGWTERIPPALDHTLVDAQQEGGAWWILMRDVSDVLWTPDGRITREQSRRVLEATNLMWTAFWGVQVPLAADLARRLDLLSPQVADRERQGLDLLPNQLEAAWEAFADVAPRDVADPVLAALADPGPLAAWLSARGSTLLHGDLRDEHLGLDGDRVALIDWGLATQGHPVVDLSWYLMHCAWRIDATRDEIVDDFRRARGEADDPEALEVGLLTGLVQYGWIIGHSAVVHPDPVERAWAREELEWWVPRARRALAAWSPGVR